MLSKCLRDIRLAANHLSNLNNETEAGLLLGAQEAGVLVSRKNHGAHHRSPFDGHYCIVSGMWDPLLDGTEFFRKLEHFFHQRTGVEPRSWYEPNEDWKELERPQST